MPTASTVSLPLDSCVTDRDVAATSTTVIPAARKPRWAPEALDPWQDSPARLDLLFYLFAHCELGAIFAARRVCKSWRERIDSTHSSSNEWRLVFQAFVPASTTYDPCGFDWRAALVDVSLIRPLFRFPLTFGTDAANVDGPLQPNFGHVRADQLVEVLECLERSGEVAAVDLGIPFSQVLSLRNGFYPKLSALIYKACTQRPPHNHAALVYTWWTHALPRLASRIASRSKHANQAEQRLACDSFDSWVRKISLALGYLNRYHVARLNLPRLEEAAVSSQQMLREALGCCGVESALLHVCATHTPDAPSVTAASAPEP